MDKAIGVVIPWPILTLVLAVVAAWLMVLGIQLSTRWAGYFGAMVISYGLFAYVTVVAFRCETFSQMSSFGALLVLVVYLLANLALPVFFRRFAPERYRTGPHLAVPLLSVIAIFLPALQLARRASRSPTAPFPGPPSLSACSPSPMR